MQQSFSWVELFGDETGIDVICYRVFVSIFSSSLTSLAVCIVATAEEDWRERHRLMTTIQTIQPVNVVLVVF
jgi:hypothetical protein